MKAVSKTVGKGLEKVLKAKDFIELGNDIVQQFGSQLSVLIPGLTLGSTKTKCQKCQSNLRLHRYYVANDNYAQCIACGQSNSPGDAYFYCPKCSPWGFCGTCVSKGVVPYGCDTKKCGKCKGSTLKSYKFYGANFNYKNCNNCQASIGLNCFYWYCCSCSSYGYCYPCTMKGLCGTKG